MDKNALIAVSVKLDPKLTGNLVSKKKCFFLNIRTTDHDFEKEIFENFNESVNEALNFKLLASDT